MNRWLKRDPHVHSHEPRWPSLVALLGMGALYAALPDALTPGPRWLLPVVLAIGVFPSAASHRLGFHRLNQLTGYVLLSVCTGALVWALAGLLAGVLRNAKPNLLLRSAAVLWCANVLVFASWYWRLDAGGPHARSMRGHHREGAFLFPQMTLAEPGWRPGFVDYVFLAFNTSTAFSPTDTAVLSRWAKALMMVQALISLATLAVVAARAVNVL